MVIIKQQNESEISDCSIALSLILEDRFNVVVMGLEKLNDHVQFSAVQRNFC